MILSARFLNDVSNINSFQTVEVGQFTEGDSASVFFQLIDSTLDLANKGFNPPGRRFIPATGATLQVIVDSIDDAKKITRSATNPFLDDRSIWKLDFIASDKISGTANFQLVLTEGTIIKRGVVKSGMRIASATGCI
jgi:hypothetical protein